jgi:hypothetical protein
MALIPSAFRKSRRTVEQVGRQAIDQDHDDVPFVAIGLAKRSSKKQRGERQHLEHREHSPSCL